MADRFRISFRWRRRPPAGLTARLRDLAVHVLGAIDAAPGEIGVLVCDDETMRSLNRHFRDKDSSTDVLSFPSGEPQPDGPIYLGDIAISIETAARQAQAAPVALELELETLLLHGLLHVCGWDHEADEGEMEALEARLRRELVR